MRSSKSPTINLAGPAITIVLMHYLWPPDHLTPTSSHASESYFYNRYHVLIYKQIIINAEAPLKVSKTINGSFSSNVK